jgi:hypothetical protein
MSLEEGIAKTYDWISYQIEKKERLANWEPLPNF